MSRLDRTLKQIAADALDLEIFRVVQQIDRFANLHHDEPAREMAVVIDGMREMVRKHMHADDRAGTR